MKKSLVLLGLFAFILLFSCNKSNDDLPALEKGYCRVWLENPLDFEVRFKLNRVGQDYTITTRTINAKSMDYHDILASSPGVGCIVYKDEIGSSVKIDFGCREQSDASWRFELEPDRELHIYAIDK